MEERNDGFGELYLRLHDEKSKSDNEIDIQAYAKLIDLDSKLGVTASEQLYMCIYYSSRLDLIKVKNHIRFFYK